MINLVHKLLIFFFERRLFTNLLNLLLLSEKIINRISFRFSKLSYGLYLHLLHCRLQRFHYFRIPLTLHSGQVWTISVGIQDPRTSTYLGWFFSRWTFFRWDYIFFPSEGLVLLATYLTLGFYWQHISLSFSVENNTNKSEIIMKVRNCGVEEVKSSNRGGDKVECTNKKKSHMFRVSRKEKWSREWRETKQNKINGTVCVKHIFFLLLSWYTKIKEKQNIKDTNA